MEDLTGHIFSRLTVLGFAHKRSGKRYWKCQCDCGNIKSYRNDLLKIGRRKSCGCINSPTEDEYKMKLGLRLLRQTKRIGDCLIWTGRFNPYGYGIFKMRSSSTKGLTSKIPKEIYFSCGTHRIAYFVWHGDIPNGMCVLHKCDNKACIEPSHLFLGSHQENMDDMKRKNRQNKRPGIRHHMAILIDKDVIEMRRLWDNRLETQIGIAKKFNVSLSTAHNVIRRKTWIHI